MKILLDENLHISLPQFMPSLNVTHVLALGWQGTKNGKLMAKAQDAGFEVIVTADKNMPYQQNIRNMALALVVLDIHPNALMHQAACVPMLDELLPNVVAGEVYVIEGPRPKRRSL
ncbi:MAG TPA: DUF5615 family PIN-like protein [Fimbriimonadaceae bacterium]